MGTEALPTTCDGERWVRTTQAEFALPLEGDETRDSDAEADDSSAGSAAEQAEKREREMEESGDENAG